MACVSSDKPTIDCCNCCSNNSCAFIPAAPTKADAILAICVLSLRLTNALVCTGTADAATAPCAAADAAPCADADAAAPCADAAPSTDAAAPEAFGVVPPCCPRFMLNCFSKKSSNSDSFPPPC